MSDPASAPTGAAAAATGLAGRVRALFPGVMAAGLVALAAQWVAEHHGAPAMLMALLFGMAMSFLGDEGGRGAPGVAFAAKAVLRLGVALLGARISAEIVVGLGWQTVALVLAALAATIGFGVAVSRLFGQSRRFGVLTAGAVAICGASAAMALAAALPRDGRSERDLIFTVLGVTLLSTAAMIVYPVILGALGWDETRAGVFLGATIHDVAQVVGAGFSISPEAGETATLVKLIRVTALAPVVVLVALWSRGAQGAEAGRRPPLVPGFVVGFLVLAAANSLGLLPVAVADAATLASRWALLTAIAAVGMKTSMREMLRLGPAAIALLVAETAFIATLVGAGLVLLGG